MRTLFTLIGFLLLNASSTSTMNTTAGPKVLVDGLMPSHFNQATENTGKSNLVIFYSSQHCGPCLEQLKSIENSLAALDVTYQLVFVDSWTLGKAGHQQDAQYAINFYETSLKTKNSIFLLDPNDSLLMDFQKNQTLKLGLPFIAIAKNSNEVIHTSYNLEKSVSSLNHLSL